MDSRETPRKGLLRGRRASAGLAALLGLALSNAGALAGDALYQWTDEQGNIRYTADPNRVPSGQRESVLETEPGLAPASPPARPLTAPSEPTPPPPQALPAANAPPAPSAPPTPATDAAREQQLRAAIAADQEALREMLAAPPVPSETALADSPQLRAIAQRLPELQAELRAVRERQTPPAGP